MFGCVVEALPNRQQAGAFKKFLGVTMPFFSEEHLPGFLIDREVAGAVFFFLANELRYQSIDLYIQVGRFISRSGDDERCTRLVDENRVHFVNNRKAELALHLVGRAERHIVAQIVETKLVVGRVNDIGIRMPPAFPPGFVLAPQHPWSSPES